MGESDPQCQDQDREVSSLYRLIQLESQFISVAAGRLLHCRTRRLALLPVGRDRKGAILLVAKLHMTHNRMPR